MKMTKKPNLDDYDGNLEDDDGADRPDPTPEEQESDDSQ